MRRRGLGDFLHYFIPEEEQREARERARPAQLENRSRSTRWCLPASPDRPLSCAVAIDLAVATARGGCRAEILAPFRQHWLLPKSAEVSWRVFELGQAESGSLAQALEATPPGSRSYVLVPPERLGPLLRTLPPGVLDGVLLPIEATARGPAQALGLLRQLGRPLPELRIGAVPVGASSRAVAREIFSKLERAAGRQLGLDVEDMGELRRDPASFRSLLFGVSVLDVDEEASSAQSLRALSDRLAGAPNQAA